MKNRLVSMFEEGKRLGIAFMEQREQMIFKCYDHLIQHYMKEEDYDTVYYLCEEVLKFLKDPALRARTLLRLARALYSIRVSVFSKEELEGIPEVSEVLSEVRRLVQETQDEELVAEELLYVGRIYYEDDRMEEAYPLLSQAVDYFIDRGIYVEGLEDDLYKLFFMSLHEQEDYERAEKYFRVFEVLQEKKLASMKKIDYEELYKLVWARYNMAEFYEFQGREEKAELYRKKIRGYEWILSK